MSLQKLFAAVGVVAVLVVLGGAGWRAFAPVPPPVPQGGGTGTGVAKSISELSINRHFSFYLDNVGAINSTTPGDLPISFTTPMGTGLAVTQLIRASNNAVTTMIRIDGVIVFKTSGVTDHPAQRIVPPLIIPPDSFVEIGTGGQGTPLTVTGYTLTPADFGM